MQRYFVAKEQMSEDMVIITGEDVKHIGRVMRMEIGDEIICCNGISRTVRCELSVINGDQVEALIKEELVPNTELPIHVTIAQGLPKGDKLELIVQKGTELGATGFLPFAAKRSIAKWDKKKSKSKVLRLAKIAKEAAEQSYRERIPTISECHTLAELKEKLSLFDVVLVAFEESAKSGETSNLVEALNSLSPNQSLLIIIGPEGGLTKTEIEYLTIEGAVPCGFGPRILRTETASLYALAAISYHFELKR